MRRCRQQAAFLLAAAAAMPIAWADDQVLSSQRAPATQPVSGIINDLKSAWQKALAFTKDSHGKLEFHARNLDIVSALAQLRTIEKRNLIVSRNVSGTITADLYGVTFEQALQAILRMGDLVARQEGSFIYIYTRQEAAAIAASSLRLQTHVFHLYYASAAEVVELLKPLLSPDGRLATTNAAEEGIAADTESAGGYRFAATDAVVVTDYPANIERMKKIVAQVDVRPKQVLIEATILAASLREDNSLGIDFTALVGVDFRQLSAVSTGGSNLVLGPLPDAQFDGTTINGSTNFTAGMPSGGLNIGYLKNGIAVFLHALEQVTDTTVLANPKVLVLNKQRGEVMVGRRDGYLTTTTTETATVQTVEFLETGTRLIFRPFIGNDGYVRLEIHPEDSTGGLTEAGLPFEETAEVTTNVLVKDGTTVVIGGLFRDNINARRAQVPVLGDLPLLGPAFRRTRDESVRQEVIILLTPHIIDDPAEDTYSRQLLADAETMRVGLRRGLQWHGRQRLAQAHFRQAQKDLQRGDSRSALWRLTAAINLYPRFLEAIRLREELLAEPLAEPAGSAIKDLILNRIKASSQNQQTQPETESTEQ